MAKRSGGFTRITAKQRAARRINIEKARRAIKRMDAALKKKGIKISPSKVIHAGGGKQNFELRSRMRQIRRRQG